MAPDDVMLPEDVEVNAYVERHVLSALAEVLKIVEQTPTQTGDEASRRRSVYAFKRDALARLTAYRDGWRLPVAPTPAARPLG